MALAGLPGTGKTTIARLAAASTAAVYLRIDCIESGIIGSSLPTDTAEEAGYLAAYHLARENLLLGQTVIADSVNPIQLTREAWAATATEAGAGLLNVEFVCSDTEEHRRRLLSRSGDLPAIDLPDWQKVQARDYEQWTMERLVIDTAGQGADNCAEELVSAMIQVRRTGTPRSCM